MGLELEKGAEAVSTLPEGCCGSGLWHALLIHPCGQADQGQLWVGAFGISRPYSWAHLAGGQGQADSKYAEPPGWWVQLAWDPALLGSEFGGSGAREEIIRPRRATQALARFPGGLPAPRSLLKSRPRQRGFLTS